MLPDAVSAVIAASNSFRFAWSRATAETPSSGPTRSGRSAISCCCSCGVSEFHQAATSVGTSRQAGNSAVATSPAKAAASADERTRSAGLPFRAANGSSKLTASVPPIIRRAVIEASSAAAASKARRQACAALKQSSAVCRAVARALMTVFKMALCSGLGTPWT